MEITNIVGGIISLIAVVAAARWKPKLHGRGDNDEEKAKQESQ